MAAKKQSTAERIRELRAELEKLRAPGFDADTLYGHIGAALKTAREEVGMNQSEAGEICKMTRTSIINLEQGRQYMPLHKLIAYCQALGISVVDILPDWAK
jgi:DNA-binding XRE family transcriptional regulator